MPKKSGRFPTPQSLNSPEAQPDRALPGEVSSHHSGELLHQLQVYQAELEMQNETLRQTQINLEISRDNYVELYEFAPVGYLTLTPDGLISKINLTGAELLGVIRKNLLQKRFASFVIPEDQDRWHRHFISAKQDIAKRIAEFALQRGDGTVLHVQLNCVGLNADANHTATHPTEKTHDLLIALTDITELFNSRTHSTEIRDVTKNEHPAERSLDTESCLRLRNTDLLSLLNHLPGIIGYWDKNLRNRFGNLAYSFWFGISPEQMQGKHIREVIGEVSYRLNLPYIEGALRGEAQRFERDIPAPDNMQVRHALVEYIPDIADGEVQGFYVQVTDISTLKIAEALIASEERFRSLVEQAADGIYLNDMQGNFIDVNPAGCEMLGYTRQELLNFKFADVIDPSEISRIGPEVERFANGALTISECRFRRKDGSLFLGEVRGRQLKDGRFQTNLIDITKRKLAEAENRIAATAFEAQVGIMVTDANNVILRANRTFTEITGYSAEEIIGKTPRLFKSGRHDAAFYDSMWESIKSTGSWNGEIWDRRKNGQIYPKWLTITAITNAEGNVTHYVGTQIDVSERKTAESKLKTSQKAIFNLEFYDPLTQLPNRRLLQDRLTQALSTSDRSGKTGALLFIDLDNFKTINDTLGHAIGDVLLQAVTDRLKTCVRQGDTVARAGGDEFVVMLEELSKQALEAASQAEAIGEKILSTLNQPYYFDGRECISTSSIGVALFNGHQQAPDDLFKQADIAMYQAKKGGRNTLRFFDPQMQEAINIRSELEDALRKALEMRQFHLYYQIQMDSLHRPLGAEALIRWKHPERGLVSPAAFIPIVEDTGLILPIGQWVLETACAQLKAWQPDAKTRDLILSVNVSAKQFLQADFVAQVQSIVQRYTINPTRLKLELTESILLDNIENIIATMNAINAIGIRFSLDDFGTGYSSLQYLKQLPLHQLKIDQSFVRDLTVDSSDRAIVRTIIAMAHSLNLDVIAEGVETEEQRQLLLNKGCTNYQGYLFGKPMPIAEFEKLLGQG